MKANHWRCLSASAAKADRKAMGGSSGSGVCLLEKVAATALARVAPGAVGLSKISVQSGTSHGGVVLADGSIADVKLDLETLRELSEIARKEYGLSGAVQHGASTLPDDAFRQRRF